MNLPTLTAFKIKDNAEATQALGLAVPIGAIVISLIIAAFIIWPKIQEIMALRTDNQQLVSRAQVLEKKASTLATLDKSKLEEQLISAEQLLPSDKNVFSILRQIEGAASATGVLLNKVEVVAGTINTAPGANSPNVPVSPPVAPLTPGAIGPDLAPKVQLRLSTTSDYTSLLKFLTSLYSFSRVVSIDAISLSAAIGESLQLRTSFTVDAFWKSLPQELGSIENPVENLTSSEVLLG